MPSVFYPPGQITPMGARKLLEGVEPMAAYRSFNDEVVFHLMGAFAPMPGVQPGITIDSLKNIIPSWHMQDQQTANQDGVTNIGSVLEPIEFDMVVDAHGNTPQECREVVRDWIDSWHRKHTGELSVCTPEMGFWWAKARWLKTPTDPLARATSCTQRFTWTGRIDTGCWRSIPSVSQFGFTYDDMLDTFAVDHYGQGGFDLGSDWPQYYDGDGGGFCYSKAGRARWFDDPDDLFTTRSREVVNGPYKDFETTTDNQVVRIQIATPPEWSLPNSGANDLWARMGRNVDGTWDGCGIRARITLGAIHITAFVDFDVVWERTMRAGTREHPFLIIPFFRDDWRLIAGFEGDPRKFQVTRNGANVLTYKESGTASRLGADYRGIGFGMRAGGAFITQATPASVMKVTAGDNATVSQSGVLPLTNIGDQDEAFRLTVWGPGMFTFSNGPDATKTIKFGPLKDGQVVQIRSDLHNRGVVDFSAIDPATEDLAELKDSIAELSNLAAAGNIGPLLERFESAFGKIPPQGELYRLLDGRFTKMIPAKEPGKPAVETRMTVAIDNGNANSRVIAAITPRRVWPL